MRLKCIITDDEPFARKGLQGYIERIDFLQLVGTCENVIELNSMLKTEDVDLLFLDIEMPYVSGVEFLRQLTNPPAVIFTTAYERYAIESFELNVLDYLLKPISFERFLKAANKAHQYFSHFKDVKKLDDYLFLKTQSKIEKVLIDEIYVIEGLENYVSINTLEKRIIGSVTMKMLMSKLPPEKFIQTHKSFIAAIDKIDSIEGNILHVGKYQAPISKYLKEEVLSRVLNNRFLKR